jgi:predicted HTH transcriptional regulator
MKFTYANVGENAGKIWKALSENGELTVSKIEETTGLKKDDIYAGLGWLFKENKLESKEEKRSTKFYLLG